MKTCNRCGRDEEPNELGLMLMHFICSVCRGDNNDWHWGTDVTIPAMEIQLPPQISTEVEDEKDD